MTTTNMVLFLIYLMVIRVVLVEEAESISL